MAEPKTVPDRLAALGALYLERNKLYKDNYKQMGRILCGMFPEGITLKTEDDFNRFALFLQGVHKKTRYARSLLTPTGHADSLDDDTVYCQMLAEVDGEIRDKTK